MIGRCANCGNEEVRYGGPDVMNAACNACGSFIFWCLHMAFSIRSVNHWVKVDLRTGKALTPDPCDGWTVAQEPPKE